MQNINKQFIFDALATVSRDANNNSRHTPINNPPKKRVSQPVAIMFH